VRMVSGKGGWRADLEEKSGRFAHQKRLDVLRASLFPSSSSSFPCNYPSLQLLQSPYKPCTLSVQSFHSACSVKWHPRLAAYSGWHAYKQGALGGDFY